MLVEPIEKIARAVLYEGYVLWPYRRSARKNQRRWTTGALLPRTFAETSGTNDPWTMRAECLVTGLAPRITARVRFLQVVERRVMRGERSGEPELVDELTIEGERFLSWDEAIEREIVVASVPAVDHAVPRREAIVITAGEARELLRDRFGVEVGTLVRTWRRLEGTITTSAVRLRDDLARLAVELTNTSPFAGTDRQEALKAGLISTHLILTAEGGQFVSLLDPPPELSEAAAACDNFGLFPVLVGEEGERHAMLAAPIILYDYPRIAPESPGDLFDGTEIDELLVLNVLSLTDEEKDEMRATDPRARHILERSEALSKEDFSRLHGTFRDLRAPVSSGQDGDAIASVEPPPPTFVVRDRVRITRGSRVRLRPRPGGDIYDLALAGRVAVVEAIEQDDAERVLLAVTLPDDPGADLGRQRQIAHCFFFGPDEVEPLDAEAGDGA
jgi:hypothetical protein